MVFKAYVAQPAPDDVDLDASLQQVDGSGVAEEMWCHASWLLAITVQEAAMLSHDLVDAEPSEGCPRTRAEHRTRCGGRMGFLQEHSQVPSRFRPERAGPPPVALAVQLDTGFRFQL